MAISVLVYSNANASSQAVSFDFVGDVLAANNWMPGANAASYEYYLKITTGARQDDNTSFPAKVATGLDSLALNGSKQRQTDTANAYSDIRSMIVDYMYDYINGHTADRHTSGCTLQRPMKF